MFILNDLHGILNVGCLFVYFTITIIELFYVIHLLAAVQCPVASDMNCGNAACYAADCRTSLPPDLQIKTFIFLFLVRPRPRVTACDLRLYLWRQTEIDLANKVIKDKAKYGYGHIWIYRKSVRRTPRIDVCFIKNSHFHNSIKFQS